MNLDSIMDSDNAASVRERLKVAAHRRLSHESERDFNPIWLCQSLHVDRLKGEPRPLIGEGDDAYFMHSVESSKVLLDELYTYGIRRLYIGPEVESGSAQRSYREHLDRFVNMVAAIRRAAGPDLEIVVDPGGLCMRSDLRWGVTRKDGTLDDEATLGLLGQAATEFGDAGVDGLITIGRINCEVEVVRAAVSRCSRPVSILSFSTNSETTSAYFETTRYDISRSRTGQKILVGNGNEMIVRSISDFGEGSDVIIQKPIEAFHLLAALRFLASGQVSVSGLIEGTAEIRELLDKNPLICPAFERGVAALQRGDRPLKTGSYEVSGTFCMTRLLAKTYSEELAWSMLDEILRNAATAAGETFHIAIARSALWYARIGKQLEHKLAA